MSGKTINSAIGLLVIGNLLAIISDVIIKWVSGDVALFQFIALRLVVTLAMLLPFIGMIDRSRFFEGTRIHLVRAHIGLAGIVCMVIALGALPLATANAIFYAAPVLVMLFGVLLFGEKLRRSSLLTVISGLIGVLVILRPSELNWAGLAALGLAVALAINAVLVRKLPRKQPVVHSLLLNYLLAMPAAVTLAVIEGAPLDFSALSAAFGSALFILGYNMTVILAYRHVDASRVTASEYTGLVWAFILGWLVFAEVPDAWFWMGATLIVGPLLIQALRQQRPGVRRRLPVAVGGSRRATDYPAGQTLDSHDDDLPTSRRAGARDRACDENPAPDPSARCSAD
ncbi:DMT family transporter [Wenzhouxiangella sp. AB-CW3]|uniref:DMT family transporter n=1 Tax=Wenzhouxiangella sp. AB-CW3 TaxID=2771012 RepID=UPI00168B7C5B|nr:DMT family transporter [Wenzhouxiangella sp. AB-CW3]QOC22594.1 DMT family transporter [Wenzhouxiangella sp. AB-CW3]